VRSQIGLNFEIPLDLEQQWWQLFGDGSHSKSGTKLTSLGAADRTDDFTRFNRSDPLVSPVMDTLVCLVGLTGVTGPPRIWVELRRSGKDGGSERAEGAPASYCVHNNGALLQSFLNFLL
jgi:hypothetical protein